MKTILALVAMLATAACAGAATAAAPKGEDTAPPPTADAQVAGLEAQCAASAEARAARHAERTLFERLGGEEGIHALTREVVRLHLENEAIRHFFDGLDGQQVAARVAEFMISGVGGPPVYKGPALPASHAHFQLTNADFLSAGGDVIQAMKNLGHGPDEIDEVVCTLVGLRDQVVVAGAPASTAARQ